MLLEEGFHWVRKATVFEFGHYRGSSGSGLFRTTSPKPVNTAPDECPGPFRSFPTPCPFGHIYHRPVPWYSWKYSTRSAHGCGPVYVGPRTVNSINHQSRILGTDTVSIGSKLGIYAAVAEILSRPDGGCQGLPRSLHSPRWRFLVGYLENISPSLSWKHYSPWGQGVQSLPSGSYGRDYHPC